MSVTTRKLDGAQLLTLYLLLALLGVPGLLLAQAYILGQAQPFFVAFNAIAAAVLGYIVTRRQKATINTFKPPPLLVGIFLLQLLLVGWLASSYLALPDVDAYHWLNVYRRSFAAGAIDQLPQRPLFSALIYSLDQIPGFTDELILKYAVPLLSLTTLAPAWLVARNVTGKIGKSVLLLIPLASPSLIVQAQMGTPQAVLIVLTVFFVFMLLHARRGGQNIWHNIAGITVLAAALYHGLALVFFSAWLAASAWRHKRRRLLLPLLALPVIAAAPYWLRYLPQLMDDIRLNLSFPSAFTTIDGVHNGWPGVAGTLRYYTFYMGLTLPLLVLAGGYFYARRARCRRALVREVKSRAGLTLMAVFIFFFAVAELLPRYFNIVILADRAWLYACLAAVVFLIPLFKCLSGRPRRLLSWLLILSLAVNTAGAVYVNNLKKHLLPDYAVSASRWIDRNVPSDKTVLLNRTTDYIDAYARVNVKLNSLADGFFCNPDHYQLPANADYIFFIKPDPKDPYLDRPWRGEVDFCQRPSLAGHKKEFRKIYNDAGRSVIWKKL